MILLASGQNYINFQVASYWYPLRPNYVVITIWEIKPSLVQNNFFWSAPNKWPSMKLHNIFIRSPCCVSSFPRIYLKATPPASELSRNYRADWLELLTLFSAILTLSKGFAVSPNFVDVSTENLTYASTHANHMVRSTYQHLFYRTTTGRTIRKRSRVRGE